MSINQTTPLSQIQQHFGFDEEFIIQCQLIKRSSNKPSNGIQQHFGFNDFIIQCEQMKDKDDLSSNYSNLMSDDGEFNDSSIRIRPKRK